MELKNILFFVLVCIAFSCSKQEKVEWVSSTYENSWVNEPVLTADASSGKEDADVVIDPTKTKQTIAGFGTCFNVNWILLLVNLFLKKCFILVKVQTLLYVECQ